MHEDLPGFVRRPRSCFVIAVVALLVSCGVDSRSREGSVVGSPDMVRLMLLFTLRCWIFLLGGGVPAAVRTLWS